jgi:hypothetical protein
MPIRVLDFGGGTWPNDTFQAARKAHQQRRPGTYIVLEALGPEFTHQPPNFKYVWREGGINLREYLSTCRDSSVHKMIFSNSAQFLRDADVQEIAGLLKRKLKSRGVVFLIINEFAVELKFLEELKKQGFEIEKRVEPLERLLKSHSLDGSKYRRTRKGQLQTSEYLKKRYAEGDIRFFYLAKAPPKKSAELKTAKNSA